MKRVVFGKLAGIASLIGVLAVAPGCAEETASTETTEASEGTAEAPIVEKAQRATDRARERGAERGAEVQRGPRAERDAPDDHRGEHGPPGRMGQRGHGPEKLLFAALRELDLTDDQRHAIENAMDDVREARPEPRQDGGPFAALAEQVRAGRVDATSIERALQPSQPDHAAMRAATAKALSTLHATLAPQQRTRLVAAITARMDAHDEQKGELEERGGPGRKDAGGPLKHMLEGLDLRDDQQAVLDAALADLAPSEAEREAFAARRAAMKKEMRARLATFASDRFDAAAFLPDERDRMKPDHHARMAKVLAAIVPVLDPAQREALADRLARGPRHGGKGMKEPRGGKGAR
jgi:Spy/CpxP family protein refolding chaperone